MRGALRDRLRERERGPTWPGKHGPRSRFCQSLHMNCVCVCVCVCADVSCVPGGCAWPVPGLCLACAWPVPGLLCMPRRGRWHEGAQQSEKARPGGQRQVTDRRGQYRSMGRGEREGRFRWLTDGGGIRGGVGRAKFLVCVGVRGVGSRRVHHARRDRHLCTRLPSGVPSCCQAGWGRSRVGGEAAEMGGSAACHRASDGREKREAHMQDSCSTGVGVLDGGDGREHEVQPQPWRRRV